MGLILFFSIIKDLYSYIINMKIRNTHAVVYCLKWSSGGDKFVT